MDNAFQHVRDLSIVMSSSRGGETIEDRHNVRSTIVTSQIPLAEWHDRIGDPTLAEAFLDRLVHGAYMIEMKGESMRKAKTAVPAAS